jgi:hypothetical protein
MGILDEAIRDHLDLKRKGGTPQPDLQRLEDEAFGPPSRPGDGGTATATAEPEALKSPPASEEREAGVSERSGEVSSPGAVQEPPAETVHADLPGPEAPPEGRPEPGGESLFHDFAAEEGLVSPTKEPEPPAAAPEQPSTEPPTAEPPSDEVRFEDTQPHDMQAELDVPRTAPEASPAKDESADATPSEGLEADEDSLELHLDEDELEPSTGSEGPADAPPEETPSDSGAVIEVVEEDVELEVEIEEVPEEDEKDEKDEEDEDVLEETPEFLRDTPEHDRLWFEQRPPKDFDFDE